MLLVPGVLLRRLYYSVLLNFGACTLSTGPCLLPYNNWDPHTGFYWLSFFLSPGCHLGGQGLGLLPQKLGIILKEGIHQWFMGFRRGFYAEKVQTALAKCTTSRIPNSMPKLIPLWFPKALVEPAEPTSSPLSPQEPLELRREKLWTMLRPVEGKAGCARSKAMRRPASLPAKEKGKHRRNQTA